MTKKELEEENRQLREILSWYVEEDDVVETGRMFSFNKHWIDQRHRALRLLGMKECNRCGCVL